MKCSLGISNFLEEISSLSHSVVFLYFFALIAEEGFLISPCYSLEFCIQMLISFLFSFVYHKFFFLRREAKNKGATREAPAAKSLQSCPTLCDPIDGSPPDFPVPGILQARTLEWVAISFSNAWSESESEVAQSCPTLSNPMDCSPPGSSVHGIFQARVLELGAIAYSGEAPIYMHILYVYMHILYIYMHILYINTHIY